MTASTVAVTVAGFDIGPGVVSLGLFTGLTYGLLAAGLVLVYRSCRFINFAHGAIGVIGAAVCSLAVRDFELPYWIAFALGLLTSAGAGALTELGVVRPLATAPRVLSMVATLGVGSFLVFTALAINPTGLSGLNFPTPSGMPTGEIGTLRVTPAFAAQAILSPIVLAGLGLFLRSSRTGLAIRAAASNRDAAATAGVSPDSTSVIAWSLAGAIAGFAVILIIPTKGVVTPETLGPDLLVRGLAAAAVARFAHFGVAVGVAASIGVVEQVLATNPSANGLVELLVLAVVLVAVATTRSVGRSPVDMWGQRSLPAPIGIRRSRPPEWRFGVGVVVAVSLAGAVCVPFVASGSQAFDATLVAAIAIVAVSVTVVSGLSGQLSIAQFAYAGVGAAVSLQTGAELGLVAGAVTAVVVTAALAGALALVSRRVQGVQLAVASLLVAVVVSKWLLDRPGFLGDAPPADRPAIKIGDISTAESRGYYWVALGALIAVMAFVQRLRSGSWARLVVAVRDNPDAARAMSLSATGLRVQAAAVGGAIAGLGGVVLGHAYTNLSAANVPVATSIDVVTATVIGGLGSVVGPVLGVLYLVGVPAFLAPNAEALSALAAAWLVFVVRFPGGLQSLAVAVTDRLDTLRAPTTNARRSREPSSGSPEPDDGAPSARDDDDAPFSRAPDLSGSEPLLAVEHVTKNFSGIRAVDDVSFEISRGEIVGLIGPNGAGKTTVFEIVSGFVAADRGTVRLSGRDITSLPAHRRSRLGIARSFQSAALFPTLTVVESLMVADERRHPSTLVTAVLRPGDEHRRDARARDLLARFGLTDVADTLVSSLPTGTRRIVEVACAVAQRPSILLLDEPSAGVAHSERDRLAVLLRAIRDELGITLLVIEHDLPLMSTLCDRLVAMESGALLVEGTPTEVRSHPGVVVAAYLGTTPDDPGSVLPQE